MVGDFVTSAVLYFISAFILFGLAVGFVRTVLPSWREHRLRDHARKWPSVKARLDHACVTEYRPSDTSITFRLDAWFSYTVDDRNYEGSYSNGDMALEDAKRMLTRLNREPVMVTYNPKKPAEYLYEPPSRRSAVAG